MNTDDTAKDTENPEAGNATETQPEPLRKPKRAHLFQGDDWIPLGVSERLLRQKPGEIALYHCSNPDDPAAEARNIISFGQRIKMSIAEFAITTSQCYIVRTEYETIPEQPGKRMPRDYVERCIRVVVVSNPLYNRWLERELNVDVEARKLAEIIEVEGPRPKGRPKKDRSNEPVQEKRGRGRPKKKPDGQEPLI